MPHLLFNFRNKINIDYSNKYFNMSNIELNLLLSCANLEQENIYLLLYLLHSKYLTNNNNIALEKSNLKWVGQK